MGKEKLHPLMFVGTGSDVGKSVIAAAFCRIFLQDGYKPAPFKAQNIMPKVSLLIPLCFAIKMFLQVIHTCIGRCSQSEVK